MGLTLWGISEGILGCFCEYGGQVGVTEIIVGLYLVLFLEEDYYSVRG